ncbi:hypothetical protein AGMMS50268_29740 [Spirochaetia bacterium]|nr:hypothetical protein AGMMS50268_29740 [Spirochaetia bacterium]
MKKLIPLFFIALLTVSCTNNAPDANSILQQAKTLHEEGKTSEAIDFLFDNKELFAEAEQLPSMYNQLSWYYLYYIKDYERAEQMVREALKISSTNSWIKIMLAHASFQQGKIEDAISLYYELAHTIKESNYNETYAQDILDGLDYFIYYANKEDRAVLEALKSELISIRKQYVVDYAQIEKHLLELKKIREKELGKKHPEYIAILRILGELYIDMEKYKQAEQYYLERKKLSKKIFGKSHSDYAGSLTDLGNVYLRMDNYTKAKPYLLEAKIIFETTFDKNNPYGYINVLRQLGYVAIMVKDYKIAETYFIEASKLTEKVLEKETDWYVSLLGDFAELYESLGDYRKAEMYRIEAKGLTEELFGPESINYAKSLLSLGRIYLDLEDYAKAESCLLETIHILQDINYSEHSEYTLSLNALGVLYEKIGDYDRAEEMLMEEKGILEKKQNTENYSYSTLLSNLGSIYRRMGDYKKAESYLLNAKNMTERNKISYDYAMAVQKLGFLYYDSGDYSKAEINYVEAYNIISDVFGNKHPLFSIFSVNIGNFYCWMGNYEKAEHFLLEAKDITKSTFGNNNFSYITVINGLVSLYQNMSRYDQAEKYASSVSQIEAGYIGTNFSFMSEYQRNLFWAMNARSFESGYSLAHFYPENSVNELNYNNTLFTKGILLRTANAVRDTIYSTGDKALIEQFEQLGSLRQQINNLQQKDDANKDYIKSLEKEADTLEKRLTKASFAYRDLQADMTMTWQDVQKHLKKDEAAIEFVSFQLYDKRWTDTTIYAALVLRPGMKAPVWVPLCEETKIQEQLSKAQGKNSSEQARILYDVFGSQLYSVIWEPLEKELAGVKTIFYSPAGLLHKISFNALPAQGAQRLADKYDLNLVSSTREVVHADKNNTASKFPNSSVIYGGLQYDEDMALMQSTARSYGAAGEPGPKQPVSVVSALPPGSTRGGGSWGPLPASRTESLRIHGYLNDKNIPAALYTDNLGNEESFKYLNGSKTDLIHLATHGFFLEDIEQNHDNRDLVERLGGGSKAVENPLLRSGLILAGGNHAWREEAVEGVEDGILTADEISRLNLTGTKLVVLSACQTGLGEVNNGEGVFGLQRAFKLAGVETLIMSLWEVDDDATSQLMAIFYQQWLSGKTKQDSFKEAQRQVRAKYPSPYYWAAFVLMD